jgi:LuxR family transcriptional regulator, maltose regulon positive regulatory protein
MSGVPVAGQFDYPEGVYSTKLAGPSLPPDMVARPRLDDLLDAASESRLTLVSAPAGWGKTTALGAWSTGSSSGRVAWLALDRQDGDPLRFWTEVSAVIGEVAEIKGLAIPPVERESFLVALVNALTRLEGPLTLVLDDFHEASSPQVREDVELLLDRMPDGFRVVVSTRSDPPLGLQRLRLAGALSEIRAEDLAFSAEESDELVRSIGVELDEPTGRALWRRTEGWAAGLRLAGLSMQGRPHPAGFVEEFAGTDRAISDYLLQEVIERLPAEAVTLLLRISILDRVSPGLADAMSESRGSLQALERLTYRDGLATVLGQEPGWYRLNTLLSETLQGELRRRMPGDTERLHHVAAQWHSEHGYSDAAEHHARAASDAGGSSSTNPQLREPLSDRELAVLRLLPTMLSNAEIAAELFVSPNTVKTHLKHLYSKLDAHDRRTAVKRARELRLLHSGLRR